MSAARTIRCENCNASFEVQGLPEEVTCTYCGHAQRVDPALLEELRSYSENVHDQVAVAKRERDHAAAWHKTTDQMAGKRMIWTYVMAFGLMGGLPMLCVMGGLLLLRSGILPQDKVYYINFGAMGATAVGVIIYFAWYFTIGRRKKQTQVAGATVTCPSCGAPNALQAGQAVEACRHCGAAILPSHDAQSQVMDRARAEARRARLERYRAERRGMAAIYRSAIGGTKLVYFIGGSLLLPLGGGTFFFTIGMLTGSEEYSPAIFLMWAMTLAVIGTMAGVILWQRSRRSMLRRGLDALCAQYRGRILGGLQGTVAWLDEHWAGPYDVHDLTKGSYNDSAALDVQGCPVLVEIDPVPAAKQIRPRALVLLACELPGSGDAMETTLQLSPEARGLLEQIKRTGFNVETSEGGLLARADGLMVKRIVSDEHALAGWADVMPLLARLARSMCYEPD
ncbi:MAG: hypothetical protein JRG91_13985 [Deltaproteobacteria bacterium]|nr:hypothetical protein [Deltaproteobacteria bacterium]